MKKQLQTLAGALLLAASAPGHAQQSGWLERLPPERLDVAAPSLRVSGEPGQMRFVDAACRDLPLPEVRRRIVNAAVQEWAFFGFSVIDQRRTVQPEPGERDGDSRERRRRFSRMDPEEARRVAGSIGGYWSAAPGSAWILQRQNDSWNGPRGLASRWRDPWSAAFISWVMCESGLGDPARFRRAIAHHSYIDQAIMARETGDPEAAFSAYDPGEAPIVPGDLLCRGSRPAYRSIAERRRQLGMGARTHCDIVVKVDEAAQQILVIGGNVRGSVRMKLLPARRDSGGHLEPATYDRRSIFAHLGLNSEPIEADALDFSPTLQAVFCESAPMPAGLATASLDAGAFSGCTASVSGTGSALLRD